MSDPDVSRQRVSPQARFQIPQLALGATARQKRSLQCRDAGGIVTAVFEALQRIDQLIRDGTASQNSDNAAHADQFLQSQKKLQKLSVSS
jgi:hypothetical protein